MKKAKATKASGAQESGEKRERSTRAKASILNAAVDLFSRRGFDGVSLDEIASLAGTPRSLALYYFESKDELWKAAASKVIDEFNTEIRKRLGELDDLGDDEFPARSTATWLAAWMDMPEVAQFLVREGGVPSPRLNWLVDAIGVPVMHLGQIDRNRRYSAMSRVAGLSICLSLAALGPLLEAKMNAATGQYASGVSPLSKRNRDEIIEILLGTLTGGARPKA